MTLEQIGEQMQAGRTAIDQDIKYGLKMIKRNPRAKDLGEELGQWYRDIPIDAHRVKWWAGEGKLQYLNKKELKYAANMGWVDSGIM